MKTLLVVVLILFFVHISAFYMHAAPIGSQARSTSLMMRHRQVGPKKLNLPADQRKALLRGLTTQVIRHGRIKTTLVRAKEARRWVDHMITLAKKGTLHHWRQAYAFIYGKELVNSLFASAKARYGDRQGGYTRVIRIHERRRGDCAKLAYLELV